MLLLDEKLKYTKRHLFRDLDIDHLHLYTKNNYMVLF